MNCGTIIDPVGIYDDSVFDRLDIPSQTLSRARRNGELRYTRKGNRTLYLGAWVLTWLGMDAVKREEAAVDLRR
jgi:hypothetical protein